MFELSALSVTKAISFIELFKEGKKESPINSFDLSLKVMKIIDETRDQIGIVFPADKLKNNY